MTLLLALVPPALIMTLLPPALPMIAQYLGGGIEGEIVAQRAQAIPFLGLALGGLLSGAVIARWGLRRCVLASAFAYALGGLIAGSATGALPLLGGCLLIGLAASLLTSGLTTASGAFYQGETRARILGFQTALSDLGAISGGIMAAVLAGLAGWRGPFVVYIILGLWIMAGSRSGLPTLPRRHDETNGLKTVARTAGSTYLAGFGIFMMLATAPTLLPFHLSANGIDTPGARAIVLTSSPICAMLAALFYSMMRGRVDDRWMVLAAIMISACGFTGLALWQGGLFSVTAAASAIGVGVGFSMPMVFRAAFQRTPASLHGHSIGLLNFATFTGAFISPLVLGPIMRAAGAQSLFLLCAAAWIVGGLIAFWQIRRPPPIMGNTPAIAG